MPEPAASPVARALGRIPSGLFIVATLRDGRPVGFLGSFVMQMGFAPPIVCVGIGKERAQLADIRDSGRFALSILDPKSRARMAPFLRRPSDSESPFDGIPLLSTRSGAPILADALAWVECRVSGEHATGDHVVFFGEVTDGALLREGEPSTHLRKNGLDY